jgi:hypothetical protein
LLQDGKIPTRIKIIRAFCPVYNWIINATVQDFIM